MERELSVERAEAIRALDEAAMKLIGCDLDTYMKDCAPHIHKTLQALKRTVQDKPFRSTDEIRGGIGNRLRRTF